MEWYIEGGGNYIIKNKKIWGRHILLPVEEAESIRRRFKNIDAFGTVFIYDNEDQAKANLYGPLYIDLDISIASNADYQKVKRDLLHVVTTLNTSYHIPYEYIRIYFSGNKGFHVMVDAEVFGVRPNKHLNDQYKAIAIDIKKMTLFKTVDTGIYDRVRLFRFPNSINSGTGLYKVPIDIEFIRNSTYEDIVAYASEPKEENFPESKLVRDAARKFTEVVKQYEKEVKNKLHRSSSFVKNGKKSELLPCIKEMLKQPAVTGTRNKSTVIIASALCQSGTELEKAIEIINDWNCTYNVPKLSNYEIKKTIKSAYGGATTGKTYGCRAIKELGMCIPSKCRLLEHK